MLVLAVPTEPHGEVDVHRINQTTGDQCCCRGLCKALKAFSGEDDKASQTGAVVMKALQSFDSSWDLKEK